LFGGRTRWGQVFRGKHNNWVVYAQMSLEARRIAVNVALGIESDNVVNYTFPKNWPADREQCAGIIGEWLQTEARYLA
jgi:hypothetical protein